MKASDLFVRQLEAEGVEYIFGLPGEETLDLLESLRVSKIKLILTRHEQAAAFMAATYGRLKGKAGVCLSTLGPGATNLVTGVAHAQLIGAPLVSISGQKALRENWQARFQLIDIVSLMRPVTKSSLTIADPDMVPTVLRNAFRVAQAERPGSVHIELPEDVAGSDSDSPLQDPGFRQGPLPDPAAVQKAADMINRAVNPLIILSAGANRHHVSGELAEFIEKTGIHAVHTQMGKGALSDESHFSLFATGIHKRDYINCGIDRADVIITIGYNIVEYPPSVWNREFRKKIINIDSVEAEADRYYNPDIEVTGDIALTLSLLKERVSRKKGEVFQSVRDFLMRKLFTDFRRSYPLTPHEVIVDVRKVLSPDDVLVLDNGIYKLWFARLYKTYKPNTFLVDNALGAMGGGLPSGIAAKLLNPDKKVLVVAGDGGFMMSAQELETAVRYNIPVVVLILNDNSFGFIKWKQMSRGFATFAVDYANPDFVRFAESFGASGMRVTSNDSLPDILEHAFRLGKTVVIECPVDYSVNYETFSSELENIVCEI